MLDRLSNVIYWTACGISGLILSGIAYLWLEAMTAAEITIPQANVPSGFVLDLDKQRIPTAQPAAVAKTKTIKFEGTTHEFPDDFTAAEISAALIADKTEREYHHRLNMTRLLGILAILLWLFGRAIRYVLAGK